MTSTAKSASDLVLAARDLFPVLVTLMQWGDRWAADDGPPMLLVHEPCEHVTSPRLTCEHCNGDVSAATVRPEPT